MNRLTICPEHFSLTKTVHSVLPYSFWQGYSYIVLPVFSNKSEDKTDLERAVELRWKKCELKKKSDRFKSTGLTPPSIVVQLIPVKMSIGNLKGTDILVYLTIMQHKLAGALRNRGVLKKDCVYDKGPN